MHLPRWGLLWQVIPHSVRIFPVISYRWPLAVTIYFKHDNVPSALANGETVLGQPNCPPTPRRVTCTFNRWRSSYTLRCWPLSSSIPVYVFGAINMLKWFARISQEKQDIQTPDLSLWLAYTSAETPVRSQACLTWDLWRTWHRCVYFPIRRLSPLSFIPLVLHMLILPIHRH